MGGEWENGVCGCFNDCTTCIITFIVPCYTIGKNAEAVGDSCLLCGLSSFVPIFNWWTRAHIRGKIREQKGIDGSCLGDCLCTLICFYPTICQEAQEVKGLSSHAMARE